MNDKEIIKYCLDQTEKIANTLIQLEQQNNNMKESLIKNISNLKEYPNFDKVYNEWLKEKNKRELTRYIGLKEEDFRAD